MAIVPLVTRFIGFDPIVNLQEKKSGINNTLSEPYTMQDIAVSAGGGTTLLAGDFNFYPPASLVTVGPKFTYTDGVDLISYHIKGISEINTYSNYLEAYLCSVNFPDEQPFIFPGSTNGMLMNFVYEDIITTPLTTGGFVRNDTDLVPINLFEISLYSYGNNPQPDGSYTYALIAAGEFDSEFQMNALMSYDFEFLLPNFTTPPTIFQD